MARAMVTTTNTTTGGSSSGGVASGHWAERGAALLAPLLHAAWLAEASVQDLTGWVNRHDLTTPTRILHTTQSDLVESNTDRYGADVGAGVTVAPISVTDHAVRLGIGLALDNLAMIAGTEERERSGIYSTVANVLAAYTTVGAIIAATDHTRFDPDQFVTSRDVVFVCAPAHAQATTAPLIVGLVEAVRNATYQAARHSPGGKISPPVRLVLDEAANIAPIPFLPALASEAGGQGLQLVAVFQDLARARWRWPTQADGFLSLFGTKILLPGIGDKTTLETVSTMAGEWDRPIQTSSLSTTYVTGDLFGSTIPSRKIVPGQSWTTQRTAVLPPGEIANIPDGHALVLATNQWALITLHPWWTAPLNLKPNAPTTVD